MMNSYAANGLPGEAESILEGMKRDGQSPDAASYLALIRAYAESGRYSDAEGVFCRMREDEISLSRAHFNPLVLALAREGRVEDAERICGLMRRDGVKPDTTCCRAMLRAYMDQGMVYEGLSFFECAGGVGEYEESDGFVLSAAAYLYELTGKPAEAEKLLDAMNRKGLLFLRNLRIGSKVGKINQSC